MIDGDKLPPDAGEDLLVRGFHELARPDGADFLVVGDMRVLSLEVQVRAAAVGDGGDEFPCLGVADAGFESADGDFFDITDSRIWEMSISESDFHDEGVGLGGTGGFIEKADRIAEGSVEFFGEMAGELVGASYEGFLVGDCGGFAAFPFICMKVARRHRADDDVLIIKDVDVLGEP